VLDRLLRSPYYRGQTDGIDLEELVAVAREVLGDRTVPRRELGDALAGRYPGRRGAVLVAAVEALLPVVHDPATSAWGSWRSRRSIAVTQAQAWTGTPPVTADVPRLVRRYLAAFGPASVADVQAWSGLTRLREVVDGMRGELRVLRGPDGAELLDLADAGLADEDADVPVRFLAAFDNAVLGHRDRTRVLPEALRPAVMPGYSRVHATVLVDGFVTATWELVDGGVVVRPLRPLSGREQDEVRREGGRVLRLLGLDGERVRIWAG
jgi:Winged helix DNA-binding domain